MSNVQIIVNILLIIGILSLSVATTQLNVQVQQLKQEKISGWGND